MPVSVINADLPPDFRAPPDYSTAVRHQLQRQCYSDSSHQWTPTWAENTASILFPVTSPQTPIASSTFRQTQQTTPVVAKDYSQPLFVDTSVEYEIPKEAFPPKDSKPLLIVHPQYYEYQRHRRIQGGTCGCQLCAFFVRDSESRSAQHANLQQTLQMTSMSPSTSSWKRPVYPASFNRAMTSGVCLPAGSAASVGYAGPLAGGIQYPAGPMTSAAGIGCVYDTSAVSFGQHVLQQPLHQQQQQSASCWSSTARYPHRRQHQLLQHSLGQRMTGGTAAISAATSGLPDTLTASSACAAGSVNPSSTGVNPQQMLVTSSSVCDDRMSLKRRLVATSSACDDHLEMTNSKKMRSYNATASQDTDVSFLW